MLINSVTSDVVMKCNICNKESQWLDFIGKECVCYKCINKNKLMGLIFRTHANTFRFLIRKMRISSYEQLLGVTKEDVEKHTDSKKINNLP